MNLTLISLIYLFGAVQAALLLVGINLKKPFVSDLKKIISLLLLAMMITMVYYVVIVNAYENIYPYIDSLGSAAWMSIAPLYYLLNLSIQIPKWELKRKHLFYFILPLIFWGEGVLTTLGFPWHLYHFINNPQLFLDLWMLGYFSTGFYFILQCVRLHKQEREEVIKNKELVWFTYAFLIVLLVFAPTYMIIRGNYMIWFELILIALFEGFVFLLMYKVFKLIPSQNFFEHTKYLNKVLSKKEMQYFAIQLEQIMEEEKPYLDKKLSLSDLSKVSGINSNDLSQVFNLHYHSNFYDFINRYRLEYLEGLILDPSYSQYKIMALAEESGFNSKATFYKTFKEKHQLTPTQFIKLKKA